MDGKAIKVYTKRIPHFTELTIFQNSKANRFLRQQNMSENNNNPFSNNSNKDKKPKMPPMVPKFNFYWIYGIIAVVFLALQFAPHDVSLKTTKTKFFTEMLPSHDIEKIVIINKERVEIFIKKESLKNEKYSD